MEPGTALKEAPPETLLRKASQYGSATAPLENRIARYAFLACEAAILSSVAWHVWQHALAIRQMIGAPFEFDYEEGNILNTLVRISHGLSPYPDPHAFPNVLNPYGPVAYYLLAIPVKLFGVSFLGPRLMIVASVAAICVFLTLLLAKLTGRRLVALAFGCMYAALMMVRGWSALLRVDLLALALITAGVYVFAVHCATESGEEGGTRTWWLAAALLAAGVLTKHSYLAAPAACVLSLAMRRSWKQAARLTAMLLAIGAAVIALGAAFTRGAMVVDMFRSHPDPFVWSRYLYRMARIVAIHQVLVALAILYLIAEIVRRRVSAPALWVLLATVGAITAGKLGSGWNHFLEFPLALCLCAGLGWDVLRRLPMRILATGAAATATVFLLLFLKDQTPTQNVWKPVEGCAAAYQFVREQSSDRILSENVGALVLGGKTVWISNPFVYSQLAMHGGSDAPLREMLGNGSFDFIITAWSYLDSPYLQAHGSERFSPEAIQLMAANYRLTKVFQCPDARYVYQPMAAAAQATR